MDKSQSEDGGFGGYLRSWWPVAVAALASPVILAIALVSGMERDITLFCVLYPIETIGLMAYRATLESYGVSHGVPPVFIVITTTLALLQFPIYSYYFFVSRRRQNVAPALGVAHFLLAIIAFGMYVWLGN